MEHLLEVFPVDIYQLLKNMTFREKLAQLTQLDGSFHIAQEDGQPTGPLFAMNITEEDVAQSGTVLGAFGALELLVLPLVLLLLRGPSCADCPSYPDWYPYRRLTSSLLYD